MNIDIKYNWDLEALLNNSSLDDLYNDWLAKMNQLISIYPNIFDSEQNFINWLNCCEEYEKIFNRLSNYLSNKHNEDLSDPRWISWLQKISNDGVKLTNVISNYEILVLQNKVKIEIYLQNPIIQPYRRVFELIFRNENHLLSEKEELLLSKISRYNGGFEDIFSVLSDSEIKFSDAKNSQNEIVKIETFSDGYTNLKSNDRELRKTSWISLNSAFYNYKNTLTKTLYYNYLSLNINAKIKKFDDYISEVCFYDEIDKDLILKIYHEIKLNQPIIKNYQIARNEYLKYLLNIDKVEPWDNSVDLVKKEIYYSLEEIQSEAINALSILGDEYISVIKKAFKERWISFLPSKTKQTGAYSIGGTKGLDKYYILMNYDKTINSLYTLVHELGHSLNSYYYGKHQTIYQNTSIFYAEIASITNEMLLNYYLLNKYQSNLEMKLMILDEMISGFIATTSRQIIFSNFEWIANDWINNGQDFVYENIQKTYYELNKEYLYVNKSYDDFLIEPYIYSLVTPLRISHFYVGNFYVYKYTIGQVAALIIANKIYKNEPGAIEKLFKFLSSGNSLSPIETIKQLGIDFYDSQTWIDVRNIFNEWINEFIDISKQLKK